jgi:gas vesicle protein
MFTTLSQYLLVDVISNNTSEPPYFTIFASIISALIGALIGPYFTNKLTKSREKDKSKDDQIKVGENSTMELTILKAIADSSDKLTQQISGVEKQLTAVRDELKSDIRSVEKNLTAEIATSATSIAVLSNTIDERIPKVPYSSRA